MKLRICGLPAAFVSCLLASAQTLAQNAYITNAGSDTVSVINTAKRNRVIATIRVGDHPYGVAVSPDGRRAYVTNAISDSASVIDMARKGRVIARFGNVPFGPFGVAVTSNGKEIYIARYDAGPWQ
jgi:YVTN family beta-propeller protein